LTHVSQRPLSIAFEMMGGDIWKGGVTLLRNELHSIRITYPGQIRTHVVAPAGNLAAVNYISSLSAEGIFVDKPRRWSPAWLLNKAAVRCFGHDILLTRELKKYGIDVRCGIALTNRNCGIPNLSWIPDFQHVHLPEMFSDEESQHRNRLFTQSAKASARILLLSNEAKRDFELFAPTLAYKAKVLNPVSFIPNWIYDSDPTSIANLYHLPEKFVYIPNQFWKHKNHQVVFRAVEALKRQGTNVVVVCDGYPADYRHPSYFAELWREVSKADLRDQIIYVGMLPHDDVLMLIRQCVCVVNPSLFEGWGLSVEEARSLGKRVLVSDIPTHREQNVPEAVYFDPADYQSLVPRLAEIWKKASPGPDLDLEKNARLSLEGRIRAHGEAFLRIANEAVQ
jgi:glycosyltransferase involved in cell wall biosynthesis